MDEPAVEDDRANHRFVLATAAGQAELVYRRRGRHLVLVHTGVPQAASGRGVGGSLVAAAVQLARREDLVLVPACPFAKHWLETHPEAVAGVTVD